MPLFDILKADGTREKVDGEYSQLIDGALEIVDRTTQPIVCFAPGTWLEVWRREGVSEGEHD